MNCTELKDALHAYMDGELDPLRSLEVERHLPDCPACAGAVHKQQALRATLQGASLYHRAPARLRQRVLSSVQPKRRLVLSRRWLAVAASIALTAIVVWGAMRLLFVPSHADLVAQEVVSSHIRSLLAVTPIDVPSSNNHVVKPWFNDKVGFAPPVKDLETKGFELVGGRRDYVDGHIVAAVVYRRHKHLINLFVMPAGNEGDQAPHASTREGHHLIHWVRGGQSFWAVSDLNEQELAGFANLVQQP